MSEQSEGQGPTEGLPVGRPASPGRAGSPYFRLRLAAFVVIAVAVLGTAFTLTRPMERSHAPADAVYVVADMWGFTPSTVEAKAGVPITIHLVNPDSEFHVDGGYHQFAIPELGVDVLVPPRSERIITFTARTPGTYTFFCDVCCGGKDNPAMRGTLTVTS